MDNEIISGESEAFPMDSEILPAESEAFPTDSEILPAESEAFPTDSEILPVGSDAFPTDGEIFPVESEASPADSEILPVESEAFPTDGETMGTVKWFSRMKGWGFIEPDGGDRDVFVHYENIVGDGFRNLEKGERVRFHVEETPKGPKAIDVASVGVHVAL